MDVSFVFFLCPLSMEQCLIIVMFIDKSISHFMTLKTQLCGECLVNKCFYLALRGISLHEIAAHTVTVVIAVWKVSILLSLPRNKWDAGENMVYFNSQSWLRQVIIITFFITHNKQKSSPSRRYSSSKSQAMHWRLSTDSFVNERSKRGWQWWATLMQNVSGQSETRSYAENSPYMRLCTVQPRPQQHLAHLPLVAGAEGRQCRRQLPATDSHALTFTLFPFFQLN